MLADAPLLAPVLGRAFFDDPVASFLFPDRRTRPRRLERFFDLQLRRNYLRRGEVYTTQDHSGVALWMPPRAPAPTVGERTSHWWFSLQLGARRADAHRLTALLEARHPAEPHWYLGAIGVDPKHQGRGIGTALLEVGLAACDDRVVGVYLEASGAASARLYARCGFLPREIFDPASFGARGPVLYPMYRPARGHGA